MKIIPETSRAHEMTLTFLLNSDDQQFNQYEQNETPPLTSNH